MVAAEWALSFVAPIIISIRLRREAAERKLFDLVVINLKA